MSKFDKYCELLWPSLLVSVLIFFGRSINDHDNKIKALTEAVRKLEATR